MCAEAESESYVEAKACADVEAALRADVEASRLGLRDRVRVMRSELGSQSQAQHLHLSHPRLCPPRLQRAEQGARVQG